MVSDQQKYSFFKRSQSDPSGIRLAYPYEVVTASLEAETEPQIAYPYEGPSIAMNQSVYEHPHIEFVNPYLEPSVAMGTQPAYAYQAPSGTKQQFPFVFEKPAQTKVRLQSSGRNRSLNLSDLNNVPLEQQQQANLSEEKWTKYMTQEIEQARRPSLVKHKAIFSVPRALFEVRPRAYCPRIVTIGPLCRKLGPSPMDSCKALCVKQFMNRIETFHIIELMNHTIPEPDDLLDIYFGLPKYNIETLQLMVTVDCVFLHEFLLFLSEGCCEEDERVGYLYAFFNSQITWVQVMRDLFLVGNQLPISYLKQLTLLPIQDMSLEDLLFCLEHLVWRNNPFCMSHSPKSSDRRDFKESINGISFLDHCEHLLDCLYVACVGKEANDNPEEFNQPCARLRTASDLSKVGIKFKGRKGNISVVKYNKRSLKLDLPKLTVFAETEDVFRNLVAYELTSKPGGPLCGYAMIMDSLIDTADDLAILYRAGVLENHLGSDERLLRMWNEMCINITESSIQRWEEMTKDIMTHYKSHWRVMYIEFYSQFFSRPWLWLSTIAAILLIAMSALQTIYTVAGYYKT